MKEEAGNETQEKVFKSKVIIEATQRQIAGEYKDPILNGADPVYKGTELIPVKIGDKGVVTKADLNDKWYSYEEHIWANAVILTDNKEDTYEAGDVINEEDIESYFVWIPKYRYRLWDLGKYSGTINVANSRVHSIEIEFGLEDTKDGYKQCETPLKSGASGNCHVGDFMTHPAFLTFGGNGLWVGKFKTGYKQTESLSEDSIKTWKLTDAQKDNNTDVDKVIIKPNVYNWSSITATNAFRIAKNYEMDLQSHMMKNTEWGAVAYLSHSIYGRCDGNTCTEVRINNSSNCVTGFAAQKEPTTGYGMYNESEAVTPMTDGNKSYNYNNPDSQVASTTGNYFGIYDLSDMSQTYVMAIIKGNYASSPMSEDDLSNPAFYDEYTSLGGSDHTNDYTKRILGDATGEMGPFVVGTNVSGTRATSSWYNDDAWSFIFNTKPWFVRGGSNGISSGVFGFSANYGNGVPSLSFYLVLAPSIN